MHSLDQLPTTITTIIDGRKISTQICIDLKQEIACVVVQNNLPPVILAIILVGDDPASKIYIANKKKAAAHVGILIQEWLLATNIAESELLQLIDRLNHDQAICGIILQLPLPAHINKLKVIMTINPAKDVDGFHPMNVGLLYSSHSSGFVPCTARGCLHLIKEYIPNLVGKNAVVIGRSEIVGRPLAALLLKADCTVTICHAKTLHLKHITKQAAIVIVAIGQPKMLNKDYFNKDCLVIDVGINRVCKDGNTTLVGDVDFASVQHHVKYITPVPGGVGPMTVAYLLANTWIAYQQQHHL